MMSLYTAHTKPAFNNVFVCCWWQRGLRRAAAAGRSTKAGMVWNWWAVSNAHHSTNCNFEIFVIIWYIYRIDTFPSHIDIVVHWNAFWHINKCTRIYGHNTNTNVTRPPSIPQSKWIRQYYWILFDSSLATVFFLSAIEYCIYYFVSRIRHRFLFSSFCPYRFYPFIPHIYIVQMCNVFLAYVRSMWDEK